ncbi:hypothetical protein C8R46DRAFT_1136593 [Mycena filopes]|nr:hypothetical protein C8R46DRAFT_1136593 [Mycena filopes]
MAACWLINGCSLRPWVGSLSLCSSSSYSTKLPRAVQVFSSHPKRQTSRYQYYGAKGTIFLSALQPPRIPGPSVPRIAAIVS